MFCVIELTQELNVINTYEVAHGKYEQKELGGSKQKLIPEMEMFYLFELIRKCWSIHVGGVENIAEAS